MPASPACRCGCSDALGADVHVVVAALAVDNLDGALQAGLLTQPACASCMQACTAALLSARDARRDALAARERFRIRAARLSRRQQERIARRAMPVSSSGVAITTPSLPPAAATALARAKAKAAGRSRE